jgi:hypothetical protein
MLHFDGEPLQYSDDKSGKKILNYITVNTALVYTVGNKPRWYQHIDAFGFHSEDVCGIFL